MSTRYQHNKTAYWVHNDNSKLPVIIMIHGYRGTHHGLELIAEKLENYRVIIPDLPGFNESHPLDSEHSIDNYVNWLDGFIAGLDLTEKPILLGHSFGSIVSAFYAEKHGTKIDKLILVNPIGAPALQGANFIMTKIAIFYYWLGSVLPQKIGEWLLSSKLSVRITTYVLAKTRDKSLRRFILLQHLNYFSLYANRKTLLEGFKASVENSVLDVAHKINNQTLLIAGALDDITSVDKQKILHSKFKSAHLEIIENVGHLTHYEKPGEVAAIIVDYLAKS